MSTMRCLRRVVGAALLIAAGDAQADEPMTGTSWSGSFDAAAVAQLLGDASSLVVLADGEAAADAADAFGLAAARSGVAVLFGSPAVDPGAGSARARARAALNHFRLRELGALAATVEVVAPAGGAGPEARVTTWRYDGVALRLLVARPGAQPAEVSALPPPAPAPAAELDPAAAAAAAESWRQRQRAYRAASVRFVFPEASGLLRRGQPVTGLDGHPLRGAQIFEAIDQPERARRYRALRGVRIGVGVLGGALLVSGIAAAEASFAMPARYGCAYAAPDGCARYAVLDDRAGEPARSAVLAAGVVMTMAAPALILVSAFVDFSRVSDDELRTMVRGHNGRLRQRLGLPDEDEDLSRRPGAIGTRVSVLPQAGPGGASVNLRWDF